MSDNEGLLQAGADPFHHEAAIRQEDGQASATLPAAPAPVVVMVSDADGERMTAGVMSSGPMLGSFAVEALRAHAEGQDYTTAPALAEDRKLDEVALGGFLIFGAARSSR